MINNLIFLDFDGVITHDSSPTELFTWPDGFKGFVAGIDQHSVKLVEEIRAFADADIVISSDWRKHHSLQDLKQRLSVHIDPRRVLFATEVLSWPKKRGHEIQIVLDNLKPSKYIILDDMPEKEFLQNQWPFLVRTQDDLGIMEKDVIKAKALFSNEKETNIAGKD